LAVTTENDLSPLAAKTLCEKGPEKTMCKIRARANLMGGIVPLMACGVKRKGYKMLW